MSSASSRFWVICCATRKIWRSYCRTSCSNAAVSPFLARATSATSGWISSVAGDWMAGMIKRCENRTLKSHGFPVGRVSVLFQCKCRGGREQRGGAGGERCGEEERLTGADWIGGERIWKRHLERSGKCMQTLSAVGSGGKVVFWFLKSVLCGFFG